MYVCCEHWIGSRAGPEAGLYTVETRKISAPVENTIPDHPVRNLDAIPT